MTIDAPTTEMPKYLSHKTVWALKIADISERERDGGAYMYPAEEGYAPIRLSAEFIERHKPQVGGYYVVYEDGYASWSPAAAFDSGYTRV